MPHSKQFPAMPGEFALIDRFFRRPDRERGPHAAALGIGDDCALLAPAADRQTLAISTDMLVAGRHFFADADPHAIGHKTLAVNLSDLAAMGAVPRAFTLACALPAADQAWLAAFADGLFALADRFGCELIGGDTTAGPLNLCVTIFGDVPAGAALRRAAAQPGDDVWISGELGDARLALGALRGEWPLAADALAVARRRLDYPEPRVAFGAALRGLAHAAIDLSDGLAGDLAHILESSDVAAELRLDDLPRSAQVAAQPLELQRRVTAAGGDDYELCFTAPPAARADVAAAAARCGLRATRVGTITPHSADAPARPADRISWRDAAGAPLPAAQTALLRGFDHFDD